MCVEQFREIAIAHLVRGHGKSVRLSKDDAVGFHVAKKEQLVLQNGEPQRGAELVFAILGNGRGVPISGVEGVVSKVLPQIAMHCVAPRFQTGIDYSAGGMPEFGAIVSRLDFELGEGVRRRAHDKARAVQEVHDVVVVVHTVQNEVVLLRTLSVGLEVPFATATGAVRWRCSRGQLRNVDPVTTIEGSVVYNLRGHNLPG